MSVLRDTDYRGKVRIPNAQIEVSMTAALRSMTASEKFEVALCVDYATSRTTAPELRNNKIVKVIIFGDVEFHYTTHISPCK